MAGFTVSLLAGWFQINLSPSGPEVVVDFGAVRLAHAACGVLNADCTAGGGSGTKSSVIVVDHVTTQEEWVAKVEPDSGETWSVTAYWATTSVGVPCSCTEISATATVDVDWNQSTNTWDVTCTSGCDATNGPIHEFVICDDTTCAEGPGTEHSWTYSLEGEFDQSRTTCNRPAYLQRVVWTTTSVDDGDTLDSLGAGCSEQYAMSPTSQTFTVTDTGTFTGAGYFVCYPGDCEGPPVTITYDF